MAHIRNSKDHPPSQLLMLRLACGGRGGDRGLDGKIDLETGAMYNIRLQPYFKDHYRRVVCRWVVSHKPLVPLP